MTDTPIPPTNQPGKTAWEPMVLKKVGRLGDIMQGGGTTPVADGKSGMGMTR